MAPFRVKDTPEDPQPCIHVTLGIGGDIAAELGLRRYVPNCRFFGADPIREGGLIYESIGKYYELGVSDESGSYTGTVSRSITSNITAVSMVEFFKRYLNKTTIDYFFLDNDGPEHRIMAQFLDDGVITQNEIVICQMSVEMHNPSVAHGTDKFTYQKLLVSLLENSALLPLWATYGYTHERWFFINAKNTYCVEKYLRPAFSVFDQ